MDPGLGKYSKEHCTIAIIFRIIYRIRKYSKEHSSTWGGRAGGGSSCNASTAALLPNCVAAICVALFIGENALGNVDGTRTSGDPSAE
eukprot:gene19754-biopygen6286